MSSRAPQPPSEDVDMTNASDNSSSTKVRSREEDSAEKNTPTEPSHAITPPKKQRTSSFLSNENRVTAVTAAISPTENVKRWTKSRSASRRQTSINEHLKNDKRRVSTLSRHEEEQIQLRNEKGEHQERHAVTFSPEPYPLSKEDRKQNQDRIRSNDVRFTLAFQLSADNDEKSSVLHRKAYAAQTILQIVDAAARFVHEDIVLRPWRDTLKVRFPPEKISKASEWEDTAQIRNYTASEIYVGRGGWVNTKIRLGFENKIEDVEKSLQLAASSIGAFSGRANVSPLQCEDVTTVGWFYMSTDAVDLKRLSKILSKALNGIKINCEYRNIYVPQKWEMNIITGEKEPVYPQVKAIHVDTFTEYAQTATEQIKEWFVGENTEFIKKHLLPPMKLVDPHANVRGISYREKGWLQKRSRQRDFLNATTLVCLDSIKDIDGILKDKQGRTRTLRQFVMKIGNKDDKTKGCHPHLFTHVDMDPKKQLTIFQFPKGLGERPRDVAENILAYLRHLDKDIRWDPLFSVQHREEADLDPWEQNRKDKEPMGRKESQFEQLLSGPKGEETKKLEESFVKEAQEMESKRNKLSVETLMAGYHIEKDDATNSLATNTRAGDSDEEMTVASMETFTTRKSEASISRKALEAMMSLNLLTDEQMEQLKGQGVDLSQLEIEVPPKLNESEEDREDVVSVLSIDEEKNQSQDSGEDSIVDEGNPSSNRAENLEGNEANSHQLQLSEESSSDKPRLITPADRKTLHTLDEDLSDVADKQGATRNGVGVTTDSAFHDVVQFVDGDIVLTNQERERRGIPPDMEHMGEEDASLEQHGDEESTSFSQYRREHQFRNSDEGWDTSSQSTDDTSEDDHSQRRASNPKDIKKYPGKSAKANSTARGKG